MNLMQAIMSGKPFRRPDWVYAEDEFQWVIFNPEQDLFNWCHVDGIPSGNIFGDIHSLTSQNEEWVDDYETYQESQES